MKKKKRTKHQATAHKPLKEKILLEENRKKAIKTSTRNVYTKTH